MTALAKRAVACAGFRWMPGMQGYALRTDGDRGLEGGVGARFRVSTHGDDPTGLGLPVIPDLDDPATLGCFEHGLLPAAWGGVPVDRESWLDGYGVKHYQVCVHLAGGCRDFESTIGFGHCFVMALEAAPGPVTP